MAASSGGPSLRSTRRSVLRSRPVRRAIFLIDTPPGIEVSGARAVPVGGRGRREPGMFISMCTWSVWGWGRRSCCGPRPCSAPGPAGGSSSSAGCPSREPCRRRGPTSAARRRTVGTVAAWDTAEGTHRDYPPRAFPSRSACPSTPSPTASSIGTPTSGRCGVGVVFNGDDHAQYTSCHGQPGTQAIAIGDRVTVGQHLLDSASTGNTIGPHLHFAIHADGTQRCPQPFFVAIADGQPLAPKGYRPPDAPTELDVLPAIGDAISELVARSVTPAEGLQRWNRSPIRCRPQARRRRRALARELPAIRQHLGGR